MYDTVINTFSKNIIRGNFMKKVRQKYKFKEIKGKRYCDLMKSLFRYIFLEVDEYKIAMMYRFIGYILE